MAATIAHTPAAVWTARTSVRGRLVVVTAVAAVLLVGAITAVGFARSAPPRLATIPLAAVPAGVSARTVGDRHLFFVRDAGTDDVRAFLADSPHATATRVRWCESAGVFTSWPDASIFDRDGHVVSGPAPTGLVPVRVQHIAGARLLVGRELAPAPPVPRSTSVAGDVSTCDLLGP